MFDGHVSATRDVAAIIPRCLDVMLSGLGTFVLCFLLGGLSAAYGAFEPAAGLASLSSDLVQLDLRQAEVFFASRKREIQFGQRLPEVAHADRPHAGARPKPRFVIKSFP